MLLQNGNLKKFCPALRTYMARRIKFYPNYKTADILIDNGGHFMVVNEAESVSFELKKLIFGENTEGPLSIKF
jgi:hypothetical protein